MPDALKVNDALDTNITMNNTIQNLEQMQQWVCLECGYNMIGEMPDVCPFCGATHDKFMPWDEVEKTYRVTAHDINHDVSQLLFVPNWVWNMRLTALKHLPAMSGSTHHQHLTGIWNPSMQSYSPTCISWALPTNTEGCGVQKSGYMH